MEAKKNDIPRLEMEVLDDSSDLYKITESTAHYFIEESLLMMLETDYNDSLSTNAIIDKENNSFGEDKTFLSRDFLTNSFDGDETLRSRDSARSVSEALPPKSPRARVPIDNDQLHMLVRCKMAQLFLQPRAFLMSHFQQPFVPPSSIASEASSPFSTDFIVGRRSGNNITGDFENSGVQKFSSANSFQYTNDNPQRLKTTAENDVFNLLNSPQFNRNNNFKSSNNRLPATRLITPVYDDTALALKSQISDGGNNIRSFDYSSLDRNFSPSNQGNNIFRPSPASQQDSQAFNDLLSVYSTTSSELRPQESVVNTQNRAANNAQSSSYYPYRQTNLNRIPQNIYGVEQLDRRLSNNTNNISSLTFSDSNFAKQLVPTKSPETNFQKDFLQASTSQQKSALFAGVDDLKKNSLNYPVTDSIIDLVLWNHNSDNSASERLPQEAIGGDCNTEEQDDMSRTTSNWKNSFAAVRDRFGSDTGNGVERGASPFKNTVFTTNGNNPSATNNNFATTLPRTATRLNNGNHQQQLSKAFEGESSNASLLNSAINHKASAFDPDYNSRQQPPTKKELSNFWLETVERQRAKSPTPQRIVPMKLSAAERLEQLQEFVDDGVPGSTSEFSNFENGGRSDTNGVYPYRRAGLEGVAARRNQYIRETFRSQSPLSVDGFSGRSTPNNLVPARAFGTDGNQNFNNKAYNGKIPPNLSTINEVARRSSPSLNFSSLDNAIAEFDRNVNKKDEIETNKDSNASTTRNGCGRFPLGDTSLKTTRDVHVQKTNHFGPGFNYLQLPIPSAQQRNQQQRSPSPDTLSDVSQQSLSLLPHPRPKHNLREQMINAGISSVTSSSFSSVPNFPAPTSNSVAMRISALEKRPTAALSSGQLNLAGAPPAHSINSRIGQSPSIVNSPFVTGSIKSTIASSASTPFSLKRSFNGNNNTEVGINKTGSNSAPLSPRSTIFRTKPVIHIGDMGLKNNISVGNNGVSGPLNHGKNLLRTVEQKNDGSYSPKWRGDDHNEASPLATLPKNPIAGRLANMKRFYYPAGLPVSREENEKVCERVRQLFEMQPRGQLHFKNFEELCRRINFPVYAKRTVYDACCRLNNLSVGEPLSSNTLAGEQQLANDGGGGVEVGAAADIPIIFNHFSVYWNKMVTKANDEASRFIFTLSSARPPENRNEALNNNIGQQKGNNNISRHNVKAAVSQRQQPDSYAVKADFFPLLMDLIDSHPGLQFLKPSTQFHVRYCEVVAVRIFWNVNRSWSGRITAEELRRSNFLETLRSLEEVTDINKVTEYFSYEHFYVTYCKFWEIDTDHDMIISRDDMREHNGGALTDRIIDRIFSAAVIRTLPVERVTRGGKHQPIETIGFEDFVAFLLAEEDKRHPTSIEYWFRCVDLDGDGVISIYEMEYFYAEIEQKLASRNMETLNLTDVICNLLDSVAPANPNFVTRSDLKRCGLAHRFFNTFVNYVKYLDQESSEGERASVKAAGDREVSDWEAFCAIEYEMLMVETEAGGETYVDDNIDVALDDDVENEEFMSAALFKQPQPQQQD